MAVRSTYSSRTTLEAILATLNPLATMNSRVDDTNDKLDEITNEIRKTKTGHELHLWGNTVNEPREEDE